LDENGNISILRGSFQDVTKDISQRQVSEKKNKLLVDQNNRLVNFAHIISHNLRSHSGNLELMTSILKTEDFTESERNEILDNIIKVSNDLSATIHHLNDVVAVQTKVEHITEELNFHDLVESVKATLYLNLKESNATVIEDFNVASIEYVPAYLESIFLNLISNAIKYKHPDRDPIIKIRSLKLKGGRVQLQFEDNGLGIDLDRHKNKVFGLYKTFHKHEDSRGVGLFLTKNQIESLNGTIEVKSIVGEGTTFIITF